VAGILRALVQPIFPDASDYVTSHASFSGLIFLKLCEGLGSTLLVKFSTPKELWNLSDGRNNPSGVSTAFSGCVKLRDLASVGTFLFCFENGCMMCCYRMLGIWLINARTQERGEVTSAGWLP
jgi:hypothetical protein